MDRQPDFSRYVDEHDIERQLYRYCRGVDRADLSVLRSVYHDDATEEHGIYSGSAFGFCDFAVDFVRMLDCSAHYITNVLIDLDGDRAFSESSFLAFSIGVRKEDQSKVDITLGGRYLDRFERRAGGWKIAHRSVVYDWNAESPTSGNWEGHLNGLWRPIGRRDERDALYVMSREFASRTR